MGGCSNAFCRFTEQSPHSELGDREIHVCPEVLLLKTGNELRSVSEFNSILGLSAYYHDSAAALVQDGKIVAAAQEERFSRRKHEASFPAKAVEYCLKMGGISAGEVDQVVFYEKPLLKFDRLLETYVACAPWGIRSFMRAMPSWLKTKLHLPREIERALGGEFRKRLTYVRHHEAHAACAFFPSPFEEAAILTLDGVGEWDTASIGHGRDGEIELLRTLNFPHSLGLLYSAFTYFCGFQVNSGEYKLMGLAPYGEPRFAGLIREKLIDLKEDGSFRLNLRYFDFATGLRMTGRRFADLFSGAPRRPEEPITQREMDLAASVQAVTEEVVLRMAREAQVRTGAKNLVLAGGVALNCVANGALLRRGIFDEVWIPSAAGDAGGSLGAALFVSHQLLKLPRRVQKSDGLQGALLGPSFSDEEIRGWLSERGIKFTHHPDETVLLARVTEALEAGSVVGWFAGRMEFGPRALGGRSILGDPRNPAMQSKMNLQIKFRETFRPFAPSCLAEDVPEWFELDRESPYMLLVAPIKEQHRLELAAREAGVMRQDPDLRRRINVVRSTLPAVTHVDYSARVQSITEERNGRFYRLIREFKHRTGCPMLVNTSFNVRGEPIVCTPEDAYRCFMACEMEVLVLENCILLKSEQALPNREKIREHLGRFPLD
jgi:carbamoyltransferase